MSTLPKPETPSKTLSYYYNNKTNPADPSSYHKPHNRTHSESKTQTSHQPPRHSLPLNTFTSTTPSKQHRSPFYRELTALKCEFNSTIAQLRKEIDKVTTTATATTHTPDVAPCDDHQDTHIKQLWLKLNELSSAVNTLHSKSNSTAMNYKNMDDKVNHNIMLYEKQEAKLNELVNAYESKYDINEYMTKVNVVNTQYACLLLKLSEVNKRENDLIQSINKINVNEKTIDNNMKRIANKVKENANDIKELKSLITINNNNTVKPPNNNSDIPTTPTTAVVGVNEINYLKTNIDNKFTAIKDVLLTEISSLKEENTQMKALLNNLEMKYISQLNEFNEELRVLKDENVKLKQQLLLLTSNNNTHSGNDSDMLFKQFKLKQENVNDEYNKVIKAIESKMNEIEQKIDIMNEFNLNNFQKNDMNLQEINQILPIIPQNEDNLKIMYENVHNIEENNANLKKDITQYKCELSKWQGQLADHIDDQFKLFKNVYDKKFANIEDYMKDKNNNDGSNNNNNNNNNSNSNGNNLLIQNEPLLDLFN